MWKSRRSELAEDGDDLKLRDGWGNEEDTNPNRHFIVHVLASASQVSISRFKSSLQVVSPSPYCQEQKGSVCLLVYMFLSSNHHHIVSQSDLTL